MKTHCTYALRCATTPVWRWVLLCLLACVAPVAASSLSPTVFAVIYSRADATINREFERFVSDMEQSSDVVVYRVALNDSDTMQTAARTSSDGPARGADLSQKVSALNPQGGIAVIYPDIGEPFRNVFLKIIEGIEERTKTRVASYAVGNNFDMATLSEELRRRDIRMVIALGRNGLKAATSLDRDIGVVAGGVVNTTDADVRGMAVHSLAPDPQLLFGRLKSIMPGAKRVFVAYDPRQNGWLIRLAQDAAKHHGLELVAQEAPDLRTATRLYQEFFTSADAKKDALWLPQDSTTVEESSVLPMILQESWSRSLAVFSSSVSHVRRGALFSLYPNNVELGRNLANSALSQIAAGSSLLRGMVPLKNVLVAVNVRTASHLGLGTGASRHNYDMVFPEP